MTPAAVMPAPGVIAKTRATPPNHRPPLPAYPNRRPLRDFFVVLSLANLSYLRLWSELLTVRSADYFFLKHPFVPLDYLAAMFAVLALSVLGWAGVASIRRYTSGALYQFCRLAFVAAALAGPAIAVVQVVLQANEPDRIFGARNGLPWVGGLLTVAGHLGKLSLVRLALVVLGIAVLGLAIRFLSHVVRITVFLLLCASPFSAVTFLQAAYHAATLSGTAAPQLPTAPFLPARTTPRVVWIIFDEWDYRLTFVDRRPSLRLDAVDRLAREALFATSALPPAGETPLSIPSFVDGRRVKASIPVSSDELRITYRDNGQTVRWGSQPNVFTKARALGVNVGVAGWFLPYCRIFDTALAQCFWLPRSIPANTTGETLLQKMVRQPRSVLETTRRSPFGQSLSAQQHARDYQQLEAALREQAADQRLGLVFAHLPAPHSPFVYDAKTGTFTRKGDMVVQGYVDELALVDRALDALRKSLSQKGQWDDTVLLLTADHPFREARALDGKSDVRVPFILKMSRQRSGLVLDDSFNNVISSDLVLAILRGQVSTPRQAASWIRQSSQPPGWTH